MGKTEGKALNNPLFSVNGENEGAVSENGLVMGTYLHGLFQDDTFRSTFLTDIKELPQSTLNFSRSIEETLDALAAHLNQHLKLEHLMS
jgi:adenosylcobyric acid synthase